MNGDLGTMAILKQGQSQHRLSHRQPWTDQFDAFERFFGLIPGRPD